MAKVTLQISGLGETRQIEPNPKGTVIGRSAQCDVVLETRKVSRRHIRIFRDPFGRWIFEDLDSSNGTFINGKRIESSAVLPGEHAVIGPFSLSITQSLDQQIEPDDSVQGTNIVVEDFETEIFYGQSKPDRTAVRPCPEQLDEITELLSELTSLAALYPQVCRYLARTPKTVALVLRLPAKTKPLPKSPQVLACHFGDSPDDTRATDSPGVYPSLQVIVNLVAYRISHRVLEAVRAKDNAVMAKSIYSSDEEITVTAVDEHSPRALICVPLGQSTEALDVLYVDIPIEPVAKAGPEEMLEFAQAVSREVISTRKSLMLMQLKAERSGLNHELSLAREIQSRLAPTIPADSPGVEAAVYHKPVVWVGGDYCDVWSLEDGRLAFAIGQVPDKGLPAAMAMSNLRTLLRTTISFCGELSAVMKHVNASLTQDSPSGRPVTLFLGLFDPSKGTLEYVNAGHPQPLVVQPKSGVLPLGKPDHPGLGVGDTALQTHVETIPQGAELIVFTDGITKAESPHGEEFGLAHLVHLLRSTGERSAKRTTDLIAKAVVDFRQTQAQQDDITVFALVNHA
jgi:serine phosphatase RsbU (regulator of sigma subunit)